MNDIIWKPLRHIDRHCFACGQENDHGLKMTFDTDGERVRGRVTIPDHLRGWRHLVHGGILATIADETMAWSAIHLLKRFILTREMTVSFKKPVPVGSALVAVGYPDTRHDQRNVTMAAEIRDEEGEICCTGRGEFVLYTEAAFEKLGLVPRELLRDMAAMFE